MASVTFDKIGKSFGAFHAVRGLDLRIEDGEFVCLLGPSGCGKTTSLRMIAGLETPTSGRLFIGEDDVTRLHPRERNIAMVFQDYALYPHMTIADNIAYPLKVRGEAADKRHARAREIADVLKIGELMERLPAQISGGQQQRTSLARALVSPSRVYLFDEPLSNLDAKLRLEARGFLNHLQRDIGMTAIYVTHDQAEAMALSSRVAVMNKGEVVQYAPPMEIYRRPANTFVANFVGNPPMNLVPAKATIADGTAHIRAEGLIMAPVPLWDGLAKALAEGSELTVGVRPEHLALASESDPNRISGTLFANESMGPESLITLTMPGERGVTARLFTDDYIRVGKEASFSFHLDAVTFFDHEGHRIAPASEGR